MPNIISSARLWDHVAPVQKQPCFGKGDSSPQGDIVHCIYFEVLCAALVGLHKFRPIDGI